MNKLETEVKFLVDDLPKVRQAIVTACEAAPRPQQCDMVRAGEFIHQLKGLGYFTRGEEQRLSSGFFRGANVSGVCRTADTRSVMDGRLPRLLRESGQANGHQGNRAELIQAHRGS